MGKEKLLFINNYNCPIDYSQAGTENHLWGVDKLSEKYNVICANIPACIIKKKFKGAGFVNNFYINLLLFFKYFRFSNVYAACGDFTILFALANILHLGKRKLYMIQHHGGRKIRFANGYTKVIFISPAIANFYKDLSNSACLMWGGSLSMAEKYKKSKQIKYDFISVGKSARDHDCMIKAANGIDAKTLIVAAVNHAEYDASKVEVISGSNPTKNITSYEKVYDLYSKSRFIVIPVIVKKENLVYSLSGLTTFVDAVVMNKPVLVSDNTNMGIDVEKLGIGLEYKAGDDLDMRHKMDTLMRLTQQEYSEMCMRMKKYSDDCNYQVFCKELLKIIC